MYVALKGEPGPVVPESLIVKRPYEVLDEMLEVVHTSKTASFLPILLPEATLKLVFLSQNSTVFPSAPSILQLDWPNEAVYTLSTCGPPFKKIYSGFAWREYSYPEDEAADQLSEYDDDTVENFMYPFVLGYSFSKTYVSRKDELFCQICFSL